MKYFYGAHRRGPYFEGYYFKHQGPDGSLALIPALHIGADGDRKASLQVIADSGVWRIPYPGEALRASEHRLEWRLGESVFGAEGCVLDINAEGLRLTGTLSYGPLTPLPSDIMGPFRFAGPLMQCSHGVASLAHTLTGTLVYNGTPLCFDGGTGYIETDRGRSFPAAYLWTQCNWEGNCVMLAIADIPFLGRHFTGCICTVYYQGREYRLATYRGVRIRKAGPRRAVIRQGQRRLEVELLEDRPHPLWAPEEGEMTRIIHESLSCTVRCRFWEGEQLRFDHVSRCASFEYAAGPRGL